MTMRRTRWVVLAAVLFVAVPVGHAAAATPAAAAKYVAIGSSFAAGPGIPPPVPGGPVVCARSANNYAHLVAARRHLTLVDVTCSGATTANVLTTSQADQPPQIEAVTADTALVTVTIGGNDVNYLGSLFAYACQNTGGTGCATVDRTAMKQTLGVVGARIGAVIAAVHQRAPKAHVLVVDYFTVLPPSGPLCSGVFLTPDQLYFERDVATRLQRATAQAAAGTATLVPVAAAGRAHHACAAVPWIERYTVAAGRTPYHPNEAGMAAVADLVTSRVR